MVKVKAEETKESGPVRAGGKSWTEQKRPGAAREGRYFGLPAGATKLLAGLGLLLGLLGCEGDPRQQTRIPPLPTAADSVRTQTALQALTRAINGSSPAQAYAKRARLYLSLNRPQDALDDIDEAISRNNTEGSFFLIRARCLRALRQPQKALENAQRAEILETNSPELYTLLADLWQQSNQFGKARLYLAKALQMAPYDGDAYFLDGLITARQGDTTRALALYRQSLALKPRNLETYLQLASVYRSMGDLASALAYNGQAIRYFPGNARLLFGQGMNYQAAGRPDSALHFYRQTVKVDPAYAGAYYQAALIQQRGKAYNQALINFSRVKQLNPQYPHIDTFIGQCQEALGQYQLAEASYTQGARLDPTDGQATAGIWRVQRRMYSPNRYNSVLLPDQSGTANVREQPAPPSSAPRMDIPTLQPRNPLSVKPDSTR